MKPEPGYWMHETSGVLRPAVEAYLSGMPTMSFEHVAAMRAYVRQWVEHGAFQGIDDLKARVDEIKDRKSLSMSTS